MWTDAQSIGELQLPRTRGRSCAESFRSFSRILAIVVATVGFLVLVGWAFDIAWLKSVVPGYATMKVNTAMCFLLAGLSLWGSGIDSRESAARPGAGFGVRFAIQSAAAIVALTGILSLLENWTGWDLGIDQAIFRDPASTGRMAPATAFNLCLAGLALLLLPVEDRIRREPAQILAILMGFASFVAILGYVFGVRSLYQITPYASMALHTAINLALLSLGILFARPEGGLMGVVSAESLGGTMARRFLPVVLVVPVLVGWVRMKGQQAGLYDTQFGLSIFATANVAIFSVVSWWFAWRLHQADDDRRRAHEETIRLNEHLEVRVSERTKELWEANRALRSSEERFRAVAETANAAFVSADEKGTIVFWNRAAERTFGYQSAEALGMPLTAIMPERMRAAHLAGMERYVALGEAHIVGNTVEVVGRRRDGTEFPMELSLATWKTLEGDFFTGVIRDITNQKLAAEELARRANELARSNAELEEFAFVASHDLREPLRMVASYSQLLAKRYQGKLGADADDFLGFIVDGAARMQRLIQDLLEYARVTSKGQEFAAVDAQEVLSSTVANLWFSIESTQAKVTSDTLPTVSADRGQLGQLFQNLIGNAIKYRSAEPPAVHVSSKRNGGSWVFSISDNGIGIEPQYRDRIFILFQRLHGISQYEGTGIGLAVCKKIVERHGGEIWVESNPGEGSTFHFTLPGNAAN